MNRQRVVVAVFVAVLLGAGVWTVAGARRPVQPVVVQASVPPTATTMLDEPPYPPPVPPELQRYVADLSQPPPTCPDAETLAAIQREVDKVLATAPIPPTVPGGEGVINVHRRISPGGC